jgi:hypothetical protein
MLCHVVLVRADVSEKCIASIIRVTRIGELGTLADDGGDMFLRNVGSYKNHTALSQKTAFLHGIKHAYFTLVNPSPIKIQDVCVCTSDTTSDIYICFLYMGERNTR